MEQERSSRTGNSMGTVISDSLAANENGQTLYGKHLYFSSICNKEAMSALARLLVFADEKKNKAPIRPLRHFQ